MITALAVVLLSAAPPSSEPPSPAVALALTAPDQLLEGVAVDEKTGRVFVGSVRHRNLLLLDGQRGARDFTAEGDIDAGGFFGLAVDGPRRALWAATSWLPQVKGFTAARKGSVALVRVPLDGSGKPAVFPLAPDGKPHAFGDVLVSAKGEVFASDSLASTIYRLEGAQLTPWLVCPFRWLQGLAWSKDQQTMFAAGYADGLFAIDVKTKVVAPVPEAALKGIDGVYLAGDELVVTRNGAAPMNVLALRLEGRRVTASRTVLSGHPQADDLSLGAVAGGRLYLVGRAGWAAFGDDGQPLAAAPKERTVLDVPLR